MALASVRRLTLRWRSSRLEDADSSFAHPLGVKPPQVQPAVSERHIWGILERPERTSRPHIACVRVKHLPARTGFESDSSSGSKDRLALGGPNRHQVHSWVRYTQSLSRQYQFGAPALSPTSGTWARVFLWVQPYRTPGQTIFKTRRPVRFEPSVHFGSPTGVAT